MAKKKRARPTKKRARTVARRGTPRKKKGAAGRRKKAVRRKRPANGRRKKKVTSRATRAPRSKKKTGRRRTGLGRFSLAELRAGLALRERRLERLRARSEQLRERAAGLDEEIAAAEGKLAPARTPDARRNRGSGRPRSKTNLADALRKLLTNKTMSVSDAVAAVRKAGYKTKSTNFRAIVNHALLGNRKLFKRVARGQYTAR